MAPHAKDFDPSVVTFENKSGIYEATTIKRWQHEETAFLKDERNIFQ